MHFVRTEIVGDANDGPWSGWVMCRLTDACGREVRFLDELSVPRGRPPRQGAIACRVIRRRHDRRG